jgi:CRISPR/Cas system CSM-associated protein Csm3 (group 7 of RAMP superfamily)
MKKSILLLRGIIELAKPALIGSGKSEQTEMDVILDSEGKPFIPATSLVGVLKHRIEEMYDSKGKKDNINEFWGFAGKEDGRGSALACSDLTCISGDYKINTRDGIAIDTLTGMVQPGAKYDYQVVEPGAKFQLEMEVLIKSNHDSSFFTEMFAAIIHALVSESIHIGAKSNNGLGKIKLIDYKTYQVNFSEKEHIKKWFAYLDGRDVSHLPSIELPASFNVKRGDGYMSIEAEFKLLSSFIVRSYTEDPGAPDSVNIQSGGHYILPGSSMKGAIRARAERILNTLNKPPEILEKLFGNVEKNNGKKLRGKVRIQETDIEKVEIDDSVTDSYKAELQTRIKIDRFTGGTMEGALFDSMPLFRDKNNRKSFKIKLEVNNCEKHEAGLLLLILKDLWTGDLAVGGEKSIGRGVLHGCRADINLFGEAITMEEDAAKLPSPGKERLQEAVDALVTYVKRRKE